MGYAGSAIGTLTGYKSYASLEMYYTDDNTATGAPLIANISGAAFYIAPVYDAANCLPAVVTSSIIFSNYSSLGVSPFNGVADDKTVSGTITILVSTYRIRAYATMYTNNSTTVSTSLTITSLLYTEQSGISGTTTTSGYIDLAPGTYSYTLRVRGSGIGGSGSGGASITQL